MSDMYVMRRANGDLFTDEMKGRLRIPVWSGPDAVARYKARNPELSVYLPALLDRSLINKALGVEGAAEFFLLSADDPDADFNVGRPIMQEELLTESDAAPHSAHSPV